MKENDSFVQARPIHHFYECDFNCNCSKTKLNNKFSTSNSLSRFMGSYSRTSTKLIVISFVLF